MWLHDDLTPNVYKQKNLGTKRGIKDPRICVCIFMVQVNGKENQWKSHSELVTLWKQKCLCIFALCVC